MPLQVGSVCPFHPDSKVLYLSEASYNWDCETRRGYQYHTGSWRNYPDSPKVKVAVSTPVTVNIQTESPESLRRRLVYVGIDAQPTWTDNMLKAAAEKAGLRAHTAKEEYNYQSYTVNVVSDDDPF